MPFKKFKGLCSWLEELKKGGHQRLKIMNLEQHQ
jgi:hypothetical protein